jgi:prefoldin subunit 5
MGLSEVAKTRVYLGVILALIVWLGASLYYWSTTRDRVEFLTSSNQELRNTLGDMLKAINAKEKEIDRLSGLDCRPGSAPPRRPATR